MAGCERKRGKIFIVSAPSGCGKTTLTRMLLRRAKGLELSVSMTTRPPRPGEREGRDYYFVSQKEFREKAKRGDLLEWARNYGYEYGTPRDRVEEIVRRGGAAVLAIDVKGAMKVKKKHHGAVTIFVLPPSLDDLRRRLFKRSTDNAAMIGRRLAVAKRELEYAKRYDYRVVNDSLKRAGRELVSIIKSERSGKPYGCGKG